MTPDFERRVERVVKHEDDCYAHLAMVQLLRNYHRSVVRMVNKAAKKRIASKIYECQKEPLRVLLADILAVLSRDRGKWKR